MKRGGTYAFKNCRRQKQYRFCYHKNKKADKNMI